MRFHDGYHIIINVRFPDFLTNGAYPREKKLFPISLLGTTFITTFNSNNRYRKSVIALHELALLLLG